MARSPSFLVATLPLALASAAVLSPPLCATAAQQKSPFGLRNIDFLIRNQAQWTPEDIAGVFAGHAAGHVAFWTFWGDFKPLPPGDGDPCPTFCFDALDEGIDVAIELNADPVIGFHLTETPTSVTFGGQYPPPFWAMNFAGPSQPKTGPKDLPELPPLTTCPDPDVAYSPSLHAVAKAIAKHIAEGEFEGTVWLRFHNEPWDEWPLGTTEEANLYRYLLSYLSFRKGILDGAAEAEDPTVTFKISHGSIPRERMTVREMYADGLNATEIEKAAIAARFDSFIERSRCTVANIYPALSYPLPGDPAHILNWADAGEYAHDGHPTNHRHDLWLDHFIDWATCLDLDERRYFEFTTLHPHGKPALVYFDRFYFDEAIEALSVEPPPWVAAEAATQLSDHVNWDVFPEPGPDLDNFLAEDFGRKWCTLLANAELFCSPVVGATEDFRGLYRLSGTTQPKTGCPSTGPNQGTSSTCTSGPLPIICEDPANEAFEYLSTTLGRPDSVETLATPLDGRSHYRYHLSTGIVDALWRNKLLDSDTTVADMTVSLPNGYICGDVYDVFGNKVGTVGMTLGSPPKVKNVGQAPRIITWKCQLQQH